MDNRLVEAYFNDKPPFGGITLHSTRPLSPTELLLCSQLISEWLLHATQGPFWDSLDWHFHDGWMEESEEIAPDAMKAWLSDTESMIHGISDDDFVARAIYSDDMHVLWRTDNIPCLDDTWTGSFDITTSPEILATLKLPEDLEALTTRVDAGKYFERGYTSIVVDP